MSLGGQISIHSRLQFRDGFSQPSLHSRSQTLISATPSCLILDPEGAHEVAIVNTGKTSIANHTLPHLRLLPIPCSRVKISRWMPESLIRPLSLPSARRLPSCRGCVSTCPRSCGSLLIRPIAISSAARPIDPLRALSMDWYRCLPPLLLPSNPAGARLVHRFVPSPRLV